MGQPRIGGGVRSASNVQIDCIDLASPLHHAKSIQRIDQDAEK
jgi:hypothetical protein